MNALTKKSLILICTIVLLGISNSIHAQKSMQDLAELKDKKWDKLVKSYKNNSTWIDQLQGLLNEDLLKEENLPNPKKIGILTMQIFDKSTTKINKVADVTVYTKNYLTEAGSNVIADKFLNGMLPTFTKAFEEQDISLLEPKDYLTDGNKKKVYKESEDQVEISGLSKALRNSFTRMLTGDVSGKSWNVSATGYEFYPISASIVATDFKAPASIGLIAEKLELDAVLIISVNVSLVKNGKSMMLHGIETAMVGPINDDTSKEYKGRIGAGMMNKYRDGLTFSSTYFELDEPFQIASIDKKRGNISEWYVDGLETVSSRMVNDLITGMQKFIALDKSKK